MKRRDFSAIAVAAVSLGQGWVHHAQAQAVKPAAGADYLVLDKKAAIEAPAGKVEVVEFFWYNCPHCNAFEPTLDAWIKRVPKDVLVRRVSKGDAIADWIAKQGVDKAKFLEQYNSFMVATKASKATQLQNAYKVEGVPAMGVAGRFYTDGTLAKNMPRVLQVVDHLVSEVRAGR
jgi:protein dithiol oxidoreductase (disulfide-forming)